MKKLIKILRYILIFIISYILQMYFFEGFKIANIKPNLFIIEIIIISLFTSPTKAFSISVLCGTMLDILNSKVIGISAISYGIIALSVSNLKNIFAIESKLSLIIFIVFGTIAYELIYYIMNVIIFNTEIEFVRITEIVSVETLYNVLLTIIFYPLCKKTLKIATEEVENQNIENYVKRMR